MRSKILILLALTIVASGSSEAFQEPSNPSEPLLPSPEAVNGTFNSTSPSSESPETASMSASSSSATMKPSSSSSESSGSFSTSKIPSSSSESEVSTAVPMTSATLSTQAFPPYAPAEYLEGLLPKDELLQRKAEQAARVQAQAAYVADTSDRIRFRGLSVDIPTLADFFMILKKNQPNFRRTFEEVTKPYVQWTTEKKLSEKPAIYGSFQCFQALPGQIKKVCHGECQQKYKRLLINVACQEEAPELEPHTIRAICCPNGQ
ncbi:Protein CBG26607 [Caenorhabditis briggsae]|uniref:Protein CBG26607 n=2 Tax=Caenorhabditis briggsae TaxID=6238 RepID=B6IL07_CAEBR|nr:Protein CBG26607 [Caenorhabditis briggsae]ULU13785.1 hypothetical protein L3Y34_016346 [Caenorhabditis briggsae]CAS00587.1 Protein CBG26607 [Caenorhabditis briggsae]